MSIYDICGFKHVYDGNWGPNVGILLERSSWYKLQVGSSTGMVLKWHSTGMVLESETGKNAKNAENKPRKREGKKKKSR